MHLKFLILFVILSCANCMETSKFNVLEKIKYGIKTAGKILGLNQAKEVADLVNETFGKNKNFERKSSNNGVFSKFLRVLGFDAKKIGAIAVNAIIFIAQTISSSISLKPLPQLSEAKKLKGNPMEWLLNNTNVLQIISDTQEENLTDKIIQYIKEHSLDEDTGCIQLLICKTSPFIRSMQKSIESKNSTGKNALYEFLPEIEEFAENGDKCEKKHPYCYINL